MSFVYRWVTPVIFFGIAAYVRHFNQTHTDVALLIPMLDLVPPLEGDRPLQARVSWMLCAGFGGMAAVHALWQQLWGARDEDQEEG